MIQKFLSKYGLASHLAILAALPLALTPFLTAATLGSVVFWLMAFVAVWYFTEPSVRLGEHLSEARFRVRYEMMRDPLFWLMVFALLFALVRFLNTGIEVFYDAERTTWIVRDPKWSILPASVEGQGLLPFAFASAALLVLMGLRHGIGRKARTEFGIVGSFVAGLGGIASVACAVSGVGDFPVWMVSGMEEVPFWASSFGVWLVLGVVCGVLAEASKWGAARLPLAVAVAGNVAALFYFAQPLVAAVWLMLAIVVSIFALIYLSRAGSMGSVARIFTILVVGLALAVFSVMTFMSQEVRQLKSRRILPANVLDSRASDLAAEKARLTTKSAIDGRKKAEKVREEYRERGRRCKTALNRIARRMWSEHPWSGVGLGAFSLHTPFLAEKEEWRVLPPKPEFSPNGFWTHLAERGLLGCTLLVLILGLLLYTWGASLVGAFLYLRHRDDADIFPFAVAPLAWVGPLCVALFFAEGAFAPVFLDASFILVATVPLALSAATFPKPKKTERPTRSAAPEN